MCINQNPSEARVLVAKMVPFLLHMCVCACVKGGLQGTGDSAVASVCLFVRLSVRPSVLLSPPKPPDGFQPNLAQSGSPTRERFLADKILENPKTKILGIFGKLFQC